MFDYIFSGPPSGAGAPASPALGVDVLNSKLYTSSGNGWQQLSDDGVMSVVVPVTTAQIRTLFSTPVTLVPAPGAGKFIEVLDAFFSFTAGTTPFTVANDNNFMSVCYGDPPSPIQYDITNDQANSTSGTLAQTSSGGVLCYPPEGSGGYVTVLNAVPAANLPVTVLLRGSNPTQGNGSMKVQIRYRIRPAML